MQALARAAERHIRALTAALIDVQLQKMEMKLRHLKDIETWALDLKTKVTSWQAKLCVRVRARV